MASIHEDFRREHETRASTERSFGLAMAGAFLVVAFGSVLRGQHARWWAVPVAVALLIIALAQPRALRPLNLVWFRMGLLLNRIVSPLVLALLYFLVLTPMGLLLRFLGQKFLGLGIDPSSESYWVIRAEPGPTGPSLRNQF